MRVFVSEVAEHGVRLEDPEDFRRLSVASDLPADQIQAALDMSGAGAYAGEYCWLAVEALRRLGPDGEQWRSEFDVMIEFAAARGWVADGWVRAHVEG